MTAHTIETDYLVIGTGAIAMAFVDTLLTETDAQIVMVDRRHRPGGHWNDAYSFVRLHQPSEYYGVNSRELSSWTKEPVGVNAGMYGRASGAEVLAYYDQVMAERFLASGRVRWLPMCDYAVGEDGAHVITSLTNREQHVVTVRRKLVDGTRSQTAIPATHPPRYSVAPDVSCVPLNKLPEINRPWSNYTVVGAGKTGIDACLWLLDNGVPPKRIRWIVPRDAWWLDRALFQPGVENFPVTIGSAIGQFEAIIGAQSVPELFVDLEARGLLIRLDPAVEPTMYHCAVVSQGELAQLRSITDVVRLGRVLSVEPNQLVLEQGTVATNPDTLYVDCSASAIAKLAPMPVFDGNRINLVMIRWCQPLFSAALIAWVESHVSDPAQQNALCTMVPMPNGPIDWARMWAATLANMGRWRQHPELSAWLSTCRLNSVTAMLHGAPAIDAAIVALMQESGAKAGAAAAALPALLAAAR